MIPEPPPRQGKRPIDFVQVRSLSEDYDTSLEISKRFQMLYGVMSISPQLSAGDTFKYEMIETLPEGLYAIDLSEEELQERETSYEYFGWSINRPTRELSLSVYFPEQIKPKVYGVEVRLAAAVPGMPQRFVHHEERGRLEKLSLDGPEAGRYFLRQRVMYPMIGLIYLLRWEPLETG
jgi:hypothetical protein